MSSENEKQKGINLKDKVETLNRYSPLLIFIMLCFILAFQSKADYKVAAVNPKYQTMNLDDKTELEVASEDLNLKSETTADINHIVEVIWQHEISTIKDLATYGVNNNDIEILTLITDLLSTNKEVLINIETAKKYSDMKQKYKAELLQEQQLQQQEEIKARFDEYSRKLEKQNLKP